MLRKRFKYRKKPRSSLNKPLQRGGGHLCASLYLLLIIAAFYTHLMINYPSDTLKSLGYNQGLNWYAANISSRSACHILYNPGLRPLELADSKLRVGTLLPANDSDYAGQLEKLLARDCRVIVECSAADAWHTTQAGQVYLEKLRARAYRAVVFDGGHHLPTLGMAPDIIIVPDIAGYAVHSYMLDGMKVAKILELIKESGSNTILVSVPRWALIKNEQALSLIVHKALAGANYQSKPAIFQPVARERMSKCRGTVYASVNQEALNNRNSFINNLKSMGTQDLVKIYLAFDYNYISQDQAGLFAAKLRNALGVPVETVNQPVKVANVFWGE